MMPLEKELEISVQLIGLGHRVGGEYKFRCKLCGETVTDILRRKDLCKVTSIFLPRLYSGSTSSR
jgi:hypothetical protein